MNSSFRLTDSSSSTSALISTSEDFDFSASGFFTSYDVGLPSVIPSRVTPADSHPEDQRVFVEPSLWARKLLVDDGQRRLASCSLEQIGVEPHALLVSSETVTPELLLKERRRLKVLRKLAAKKKLSALRTGIGVETGGAPKWTSASSAAAATALTGPESLARPTVSSSSSIPCTDLSVLRKPAAVTVQREPSQRIVLDNRRDTLKRPIAVHEGLALPASNPETPTSKRLKPEPEAAGQPYVLIPAAPSDSDDPSANKLVSVRDSPAALEQQIPQQQEFVLVRLASGKIVRLPKSLLKKAVPPAASRSSASPQHQVLPPAGVGTLTSASLPTGFISLNKDHHSMSSSRELLDEKSGILIGKPGMTSPLGPVTDGRQPVTVPFVSKLSDALEMLSYPNSQRVNHAVQEAPALKGDGGGLGPCVLNGKVPLVAGTQPENGIKLVSEFGVAKLTEQLCKAGQKMGLVGPKLLSPVQPQSISSAVQQQQQQPRQQDQVTRLVIPRGTSISMANPPPPPPPSPAPKLRVQWRLVSQPVINSHLKPQTHQGSLLLRSPVNSSINGSPATTRLATPPLVIQKMPDGVKLISPPFVPPTVIQNSAIKTMTMNGVGGAVGGLVAVGGNNHRRILPLAPAPSSSTSQGSNPAGSVANVITHRPSATIVLLNRGTFPIRTNQPLPIQLQTNVSLMNGTVGNESNGVISTKTTDQEDAPGHL